MRKPYNPNNDFYDCTNFERLPVPTIAEALIYGKSARALDMVGRAESVERLAPSVLSSGFSQCANPSCRKVLPLSAFSPHPFKRNGLQSWCKGCHARMQKDARKRKTQR